MGREESQVLYWRRQKERELEFLVERSQEYGLRSSYLGERSFVGT